MELQLDLLSETSITLTPEYSNKIQEIIFNEISVGGGTQDILKAQKFQICIILNPLQIMKNLYLLIYQHKYFFIGKIASLINVIIY